jgi:hypothetical protein
MAFTVEQASNEMNSPEVTHEIMLSAKSTKERREDHLQRVARLSRWCADLVERAEMETSRAQTAQEEFQRIIKEIASW